MDEQKLSYYESAEVWVRWTQEGFHHWPDAPERRAYLRYSHRHLFHFEVRVQVPKGEYDRHIEFHDLLDFCKEQTRGPDYGSNSCEMLAAALAYLIRTEFQVDYLTVTVSEDNECGATVYLG